MRWYEVHGKLLVVLFSIFPLLTVGSTFVSAACHVVTPNGAGSRDGSTWDNAFAGLPATLVRGDTYYLADGTYPRYNFNTAESGTLVITIKKAIGSDHCTDTGWVLGTMGSGQAIFVPNTSFNDILRFNTSGYWTIDGNGRTSLKAGHGIKIDNSGLVGTGSALSQYAINISGGTSTHVTNITIRYVELAGGGVGNSGDSVSIASAPTGAVRDSSGANSTITTTTSHRFLATAPGIVGSQIAVSGVTDISFNTSAARVTAATATTVTYANPGTANATSGSGTLAGAINISEFDFRFAGCVDHITFEFDYLHDSSDSPVQNDGNFGLGCTPSNLTIQYTDGARNTSNSLRHSSMSSINDLNCSAALCGGGVPDSIDPNGLYIDRYNVYEDMEGTGFIDVIGRGRNLQIYGDVFMWHQNNPYRRSGIGNGVIDITSSANNASNWVIYNNSFINTPGNTIIQGANTICPTCSNWTIRNNLCYTTAGLNCTINAPSGSPAPDWDTFFMTGTPNSEAHIQTGTTNPFVDWPNENYHLTSDPVVNSGATLSSPYNTDPDGITRGADGTWDRGAFEFVSGGPTIVSVTLNPTSVTGGSPSTGTVTISSAAPSGGSVVTLSSNNPLIATGPTSVTVPQGGTTATFTVTTTAVSSIMLVTITATLGGSATAILTVNPTGLKPVINGTVVVNGKVVIQ